MTTKCAAQGCGNTTKGYGKFCNSHGKRNLRHGHPCQQGITKGDLSPYRKEVRRFLDSRADPETWNKATERLTLVADRCRETVRMYEGGRAMNRWEVGAARMFLTVIENVEPKAIIETCAGLALMVQREPRRFQSDAAIFTQMSRRFTGLTEMNAGSYYNHATGQVHRVYRDVPPRTALILGQMLMVAVGVIGSQIAKVQAERERAERAARNALFAALAEGGEHVGR